MNVFGEIMWTRDEKIVVLFSFLPVFDSVNHEDSEHVSYLPNCVNIYDVIIVLRIHFHTNNTAFLTLPYSSYNVLILHCLCITTYLPLPSSSPCDFTPIISIISCICCHCLCCSASALIPYLLPQIFTASSLVVTLIHCHHHYSTSLMSPPLSKAVNPCLLYWLHHMS